MGADARNNDGTYLNAALICTKLKKIEGVIQIISHKWASGIGMGCFPKKRLNKQYSTSNIQMRFHLSLVSGMLPVESLSKFSELSSPIYRSI